MSEEILRRILWVSHGCPRQALYGDDGEMQCAVEDCRLDFKREPLVNLIMVLIKRNRLHLGMMNEEHKNLSQNSFESK